MLQSKYNKYFNCPQERCQKEISAKAARRCAFMAPKVITAKGSVYMGVLNKCLLCDNVPEQIPENNHPTNLYSAHYYVSSPTLQGKMEATEGLRSDLSLKSCTQGMRRPNNQKEKYLRIQGRILLGVAKEVGRKESVPWSHLQVISQI